MKLTKRKLKLLILEVLKEAKSELSILQRLNRYAKATGQTTLGDDFEQFKKMVKTNPEYKALALKQFEKTMAWEEKKGLSKFVSDEKPQTSTTKGPGVDAKSTTTQSGKTKTTATAGTVSTANNEDFRLFSTRLGAMAGSVAASKNGNRDLARSGVISTLRQLVAKGWNPATGMAGIKKSFPQDAKNLIDKTEWTPEKMQKYAGSP
jgi:hypothetical protein